MRSPKGRGPGYRWWQASTVLWCRLWRRQGRVWGECRCRCRSGGRDQGRGGCNWPIWPVPVPVSRPPQPQPKPQPTGEECPQCGSPMVVREGPYGPFTACSGYPRCKYIKKDRPSGWQGQGRGRGKVQERESALGALGAPGWLGVPSVQAVQMPQTLAPCPACGQGGVVEKKTRWGSTFYSCDRFPACRYASNSAPVNGVAAPPSPASSTTATTSRAEQGQRRIKGSLVQSAWGLKGR